MNATATTTEIITAMTLAEAAEESGLSVDVLRSAIKRGELAAEFTRSPRGPGRYLVAPESLDEYLAIRAAREFPMGEGEITPTDAAHACSTTMKAILAAVDAGEIGCRVLGVDHLGRVRRALSREGVLAFKAARQAEARARTRELLLMIEDRSAATLGPPPEPPVLADGPGRGPRPRIRPLDEGGRARVVDHLGIADVVAGGHCRRRGWGDPDDAIQDARVGLIRFTARVDPGMAEEEYAVRARHRIAKELLDVDRSRPPSVAVRVRRVDWASLPPHEKAACRGVSLAGIGAGREKNDVWQIEAPPEEPDEGDLLDRGARILTEVERYVLDRYFRRQETLAAIGMRLGVCEARTSQILSGILGRLRVDPGFVAEARLHFRPSVRPKIVTNREERI